MGNKTSTTNLVNYTVFYNVSPEGFTEQAGEVKTSDIRAISKNGDGYSVLLYDGTTVNIKAIRYDQENREFNYKDIDVRKMEKENKELIKYLKKLTEKKEECLQREIADLQNQQP